jgi:hypothetical protein
VKFFFFHIVVSYFHGIAIVDALDHISIVNYLLRSDSIFL